MITAKTVCEFVFLKFRFDFGVRVSSWISTLDNQGLLIRDIYVVSVGL